MTCKANRRLFSRYLDGGLEAADVAALEAHVAGCAACREELARWRLLSGALRSGAPAAVPEGLAERAFRAAMAGSPGPARPVSFLDRFLPVASRTALVGAAATAAIWAGLLIGGGGGGSSPAASATDPMEMAIAVWTEGPGDAE
jgi:anti-sigma factor RsiW